MSPRTQLEKLTHAWYGYSVFAGALTFLGNGIGFFSLLIRDLVRAQPSSGPPPPPYLSRGMAL